MNAQDRNKSSDQLPPLPPTAITFEGVKFDPREDTWDIGGLVGAARIKFSAFNRLSKEVVLRLKWGLMFTLQNNSTSHALSQYYRFKSFYNAVLCSGDVVHDSITLAHILALKSSLNASTEWYLGIIRIFLTELHNLGFGIASEDAIDYLAAATIRGNVKGTSVRTRNPEQGAFTDTELLAIQSALNDAFASGRVDIYAFAITWLFLAYGPRSIQLAMLKEKDLIVSANEEGCFYALCIPRAKQKGERARESFKTRYCGKQVGVLLEHVFDFNRQRRNELGLLTNDSPLFIADKKGSLPSLPFHMTSARIGRIVSSTIGRLTGLKSNARRFRITLGQRAVDDGKDKYTVAEILDHSDTQNVMVYYEASPAMVLRLDHHLAMELAPLAQAFAGIVVKTEKEARRGDDRSSRIFDRSLADNAIRALGTCGQMSFCGLAAPFACYTCRHFQPWIDGPHEEFMAAMISDRERLEADGYAAKIYTIKDRTILAVAEVIQLCAVEIEARAEVAA